ncbi:cutinase precursor [Colletotrichum truncatum]|uniref:Cutinase n=1 Tax=Colletotrichum truncatum TaxID=5467 RepID=A0ACC3YI50_COLTU|nr:cutinase precursor [Colletotrichum truncatum]XP_036578768.1 cutinase precursor [Colletotrichum truncatum]KAF6780550.1 cutinase precursor [Colletotrichum truncatum]KAF6786101.1 cutinase precursor [Colletotrichum truncatum]
MKFFNTIVLVSTVLALPTEDKRQLGSVGSTANEFKTGGCKDIIFVWARGSTEIGNMGTVVGPPVANRLKKAFSSVAVQGVDYGARLDTNFLPGGADPAGISEMESILKNIASKCPQSIVVTGGYSQGAAVNHRAIEDLPEAQKNQIVGVVTFGDTQFRADNGQIPNFPKDKIKIICASNPRDTVCDGNLGAAILAPHLSYGANAGEGADFLISKIKAAQGA